MCECAWTTRICSPGCDVYSYKYWGHWLVTSWWSECGYKERPVVSPWSHFFWEGCFTLHFCLCADVTLLGPGRRKIRATFCHQGDTISPFLPWYFHTVFSQGTHCPHAVAAVDLAGRAVHFTWYFHHCSRRWCTLAKKQFKQHYGTTECIIWKRISVLCRLFTWNRENNFFFFLDHIYLVWQILHAHLKWTWSAMSNIENINVSVAMSEAGSIKYAENTRE